MSAPARCQGSRHGTASSSGAAGAAAAKVDASATTLQSLREQHLSPPTVVQDASDIPADSLVDPQLRLKELRTETNRLRKARRILDETQSVFIAQNQAAIDRIESGKVVLSRMLTRQERSILSLEAEALSLWNSGPSLAEGHARTPEDVVDFVLDSHCPGRRAAAALGEEVLSAAERRAIEAMLEKNPQAVVRLGDVTGSKRRRLLRTLRKRPYHHIDDQTRDAVRTIAATSTQAALADAFGCSQATISNIVHRNHEGVSKPGSTAGRPRLLSREQELWIVRLVNENPRIEIPEIRQAAVSALGVTVMPSDDHLRRILRKRYGFRMKENVQVPPKRNVVSVIEDRFRFATEVMTDPRYELAVFVDETHLTIVRSRSRGRAHGCAVPTVPTSGGRRWTATLLLAVCCGFGQGVVASEVTTLNVDAVVYVAHLVAVVEGMRRHGIIQEVRKRTMDDSAKALIVLDNAAIHKNSLVREWATRQQDVELVFLPPWSPFLNPIEMVFQALHLFFEQIFAEGSTLGTVLLLPPATSAVDSRSTERVDLLQQPRIAVLADFLAAIQRAVRRVDLRLCHAEFENCRRLSTSCLQRRPISTSQIRDRMHFGDETPTQMELRYMRVMVGYDRAELLIDRGDREILDKLPVPLQTTGPAINADEILGDESLEEVLRKELDHTRRPLFAISLGSDPPEVVSNETVREFRRSAELNERFEDFIRQAKSKKAEAVRRASESVVSITERDEALLVPADSSTALHADERETGGAAEPESEENPVGGDSV